MWHAQTSSCRLVGTELCMDECVDVTIAHPTMGRSREIYIPLIDLSDASTVLLHVRLVCHRNTPLGKCTYNLARLQHFARCTMCISVVLYHQVF